MLLDRIDIDAHGPLNRVELGPFAEHLNVVCSPEGSGKTAIARFIRDSLIDREYPLGMLSSSRGRVVWADRNGLIHCRREQDGTPTGRRTIEFESRGVYERNYTGVDNSWLQGIGASSDSSRAVRSLQLPESIVDGVITDSATTSVARVVSACVRSGLDSPETYRDLPLHEDSSYHDRDGYNSQATDLRSDEHCRMREQLADIESELARLGSTETNYESLVARREWLTAQLARPEHVRPVRSRDRRPLGEESHWREQLARLQDRAQSLRARQSELRRWIAEIGNDPIPARYSNANYAGPDYQFRAAISDESLRRQLDDLDAQMIRWRRTLLEVRGLRAAILADRDQSFATIGLLDEPTLRRRRMDGFLHAVDRYDRTRGWNDLFPEDYRPLHKLDDIDHRIDSATRQIEWLLQRYAGPDAVKSTWFEAAPQHFNYRSTTTLSDALRAIRDDLKEVQRTTLSSIHRTDFRADHELVELSETESWLVNAIDRLNQHRESLLRGYATDHQLEFAHLTENRGYDRHLLHQERNARLVELDRVTVELDACLSEAAQVRRSTRSLPIVDSWYDDHSVVPETDWIDRNALTAELRRIDQQLASSSRVQWLRSQRTRLFDELRGLRRPLDVQSPLADFASRWLVRLTAGRLRRVQWPHRQFESDLNSYHRHSHQQSGVTIDGRDEHQVPAADRALATMAVRLAAGDLLARTGRHVPLVLETHREMFDGIVADRASMGPLAYYDHGDHFQSNHPIATALRDYGRSGRQILLLTSNQALAGQLTRVGARRFDVHSERIVHPHRPVWRSQSEHYVGPHPHTYGPHDAVDHRAYRAPVVDVNRDFDMAWREAYGLYDNPERSTTPRAPGIRAERTDWARDGVDYRDGYYFADAYTTVGKQEPVRYEANGDWINGAQPQPNAPTTKVTPPAPESPFFLSVDSPVDQAPSIDAVAAARLRGLKVTHVNHLMQQDSNRLADALGLANVDAATVRRWQAECRLVCGVPQLRGFDARILVGCEVTTPAELASMHPVDLLQDVEAFLATTRGQQILLSGSSQELSRITSWIAAANSGTDRGFVTRRFEREPRNGREHRAFHDEDYGFDSDRYEYEYEQDAEGNRTGRRRRIIRTMNQRDAASNGRRTRRRSSRNGTSNGYRVTNDRDRDAASERTAFAGSGSGNGRGRGTGNGSGRGTGRGSGRGTGTGAGSGRGTGRSSRRSRSYTRSDAPRDVVQYERAERERQELERSERDRANRERTDRERTNREPREQRERTEREYVRQERAPRERVEQERELRFYLQRESPVVDAPSIGNRLAERLNAIGIYTVDDLLNADAETVAEGLDHRRIDADTVLQWQQQATLVCRVPMLRGHDAQLLVMAEVTTPEELAACDAEDLFGIVDPIARSSDGKRIVRGGKLPDMEEVTDWIGFAQHKRELRAA